jgi:hypothetical protein
MLLPCRVSLIGLVLTCLACTRSVAPTPERSAGPLTSAQDFSSTKVGVAPLEMRVIDEIYDGKQLSSLLQLLAKRSTDPRIIAVRLRLFSKEEPVVSEVYPLTALLPQVAQLEQGQSYDVRVMGKGEDLANYQVEILWGAEALGVLEEAGREAVNLEVEASEFEPYCVDDSCGKRLVVLVRIVNEGRETCDGLALKTLLKGGKGKGDVEIVELPSVQLKPGASRQVRLKFNAMFTEQDQVVPNVSVYRCSE